MSIYVEGKDPRTVGSYKKIRRAIDRAKLGLRHVGDSEKYIVFAIDGYLNREDPDALDHFINTIVRRSQGVLIGTNRNLKRARKAVGRIAIAVYHGTQVERDEDGRITESEPGPAELGLVTMHPALKYPEREKGKKN
ncbi:MAG TPA: hypothetical protein VJJ76_02775 [archaeon]|nr:hypothetical protein [archaeon]